MPQHEVADVLRAHWPQIERLPQINSWQLRTLGAIKRCRTAEMGGHIDACTSCGKMRISYNSCRNRHCPKCQGRKREQWIQSREQELLPVPYFHVVFTLPEELNIIAMYKPRELYNTLFETAWDTIRTFGNDPKHLGAKTAMISILHTWGQTLTLHPHLHCIVPGGGLTNSGKWKTARSQGKYLFPVKALSKVFRAKFIQSLKRKITLDKQLVNALFKKNWVVYAKCPFANANSVVEYLGRYTHKIAISNHRISGIDSENVTFTYKDYRSNGEKKIMKMDALEFTRRFSLHILPKGFVRIRHYGFLSSSCKKVNIPLIREQAPVKDEASINLRSLTVYDPKICPCCKKRTMIVIEIFDRRGPPSSYGNLKNNLKDAV
jgi:hypothetical protein